MAFMFIRDTGGRPIASGKGRKFMTTFRRLVKIPSDVDYMRFAQEVDGHYRIWLHSPLDKISLHAGKTYIISWDGPLPVFKYKRIAPARSGNKKEKQDGYK